MTSPAEVVGRTTVVLPRPRRRESQLSTSVKAPLAILTISFVRHTFDDFIPETGKLSGGAAVSRAEIDYPSLAARGSERSVQSNAFKLRDSVSKPRSTTRNNSLRVVGRMRD